MTQLPTISPLERKLRDDARKRQNQRQSTPAPPRRAELGSFGLGQTDPSQEGLPEGFPSPVRAPQAVPQSLQAPQATPQPVPAPGSLLDPSNSFGTRLKQGFQLPFKAATGPVKSIRSQIAGEPQPEPDFQIGGLKINLGSGDPEEELATDVLDFVTTGGIRSGTKALVKTLSKVGRKSSPAAAKAVKATNAVSPQVQKLRDAIRGSKAITPDIAAMRSVERSKRLGRALGTMQSVRGERGAAAGTGQLGGQLPNLRFQPIRNEFDPTDIDDLHNMIIDHPNFTGFEFIRTNNALQKLLAGEVPQRGEVRLLERVFGPELAKAVLGQRSLGSKIGEQLLDIANIPRSFVTAFDFSAPLRQGIFLAPGHPKEFAVAFAPGIRAMARESWGIAADSAIRGNKHFELGQQSGLFIADFRGPLETAEEAFMSRIASKIPGIRASERGYTTFLNKLRQDTFATLAQNLMAAGKTAETNPREFQELALYINRATGRGGLGLLEKSAPILNAAFFSPRFVSSRFTLPLSLITAPSAVRKMVARDLALFLGTGLLVTGLFKAAGGSVESDPRSSDFGKGRIRNTRFDYWGGFLPLAKLAAQFSTGRRKSTSTGRITPFEQGRIEPLLRFLQSKLAPTPGFAVDLVRGESFLGEPLTVDPLFDIKAQKGLTKQVKDRFLTLWAQDVIDAMEEEGLIGGAVAVPAFLGVGVTSFTGVRDIQERISQERFQTEFQELDNDQRFEVNESPEVKEKIAELEAREREPFIHERASRAMDSYKQIKESTEQTLKQVVEANGGQPSATVREAIGELKLVRRVSGAAFFDDGIRDWLKGDRTLPMQQVLRDEYWSIQPVLNPINGILDYSGVERDRAAVLARADGLDPSGELGQFIKRRAQGRFDDPQVEAMVLQLEQDQEMMRDYWKVIGEFFDDATPEVQKIWGDFSTADRNRQSLMLARSSGLRSLWLLSAQYRDTHPDVDTALVRWGYGGRARSEEGQVLQEQRNPDLFNGEQSGFDPVAALEEARREGAFDLAPTP